MLTLIIVNEIITLHFKAYAAVSARPAGRAIATVLAVLQATEPVAAAPVLASGYQETRANTLIRAVAGRLMLIENRCSFRSSYSNGARRVSRWKNSYPSCETNLQGRPPPGYV